MIYLPTDAETHRYGSGRSLGRRNRRQGGHGLRRDSRGGYRPSSSAAGTPPVNTVAPVASGAVVVGGSLSTTNGTWTGTPTITYTYQWRRAGVNIGGATASSYTPVAADIGPAIDCHVTATNGAGSASQDSNNLVFTWNDVSPSLVLGENGQTGSPITAWNDQSTGGLNDFTAIATTEPAVSSVNGRAAPDFDGSNDRMDCTRNVTEVLAAVGNTVYVVPNLDAINALSSTTLTCNTLLGQSSGGYIAYGVQIDGAGTGYRAICTIFDTASRSARSLDGSILLSTSQLIVYRHTGANMAVRVGSAAQVVGDACTGVAVTGRTQGMRIGATYTTVAFVNGRVGTIIGFASHITDGSNTDLTVRAMLSYLYGVTV